MKKFFIFDFDGVIALNTEEITMQVIADLINEYGFSIKKEELYPLIGLSGNELINKIKEIYKIPIKNNKEFENLIMKTRIEKMKNPNVLKKDEYLEEFLKFLKSKGIAFAIASCSSMLPIRIGLERLGFKKYFKNNIYTIDDYPKFASKSELYTELAKKNADKEIYVIEDSENGIKSACKAGINNIIKYKKGDFIKYENFLTK